MFVIEINIWIQTFSINKPFKISKCEIWIIKLKKIYFIILTVLLVKQALQLIFLVDKET